MNKEKNILVVSNGHGEDIIAAKLIETILQQETEQKLNFTVMPIVGEGNQFNSLPVEKIGPAVKLPSGGFARNSVQNFFKDVKAGLLGDTVKQIKTLLSRRKKDDLSIVVGDIYILLLTGLFKGGDIIFFPTAKSEYIETHYKIEKFIMKRYADLVLPRDEKTRQDLADSGLSTAFYGNLMMDCFEINNIDFKLDDSKTKIGILPGSREEAYDNMLDFMHVIEELEELTEQNFEFLTAVAGNFSLPKLKDKVQDSGWQINDLHEDYRRLELLTPSNRNRITIIYNGFGDVLDQAKLFLGMAGTANEQAAGMGKPVIIFPGTGAQFDYEFAADQKRLLGEGVKFVERDFKNAAYALLELLEDDKEYHQRSKAGKNRMGDRGATEKTAKRILQYLEKGD